MAWITPDEMMPPEGLDVLLEVSGSIVGGTCGMVADHDFFIGAWIVPNGGKTAPHWMIWAGCDGEPEKVIYPTVHAWMPLPRHFEHKETFHQDDDLMEHSLFKSEEPEFLYKGKYQYEQMSIDELLKETRP